MNERTRQKGDGPIASNPHIVAEKEAAARGGWCELITLFKSLRCWARERVIGAFRDYQKRVCSR